MRAKVGSAEPHRRDLAAARPAGQRGPATAGGVEPGRWGHRFGRCGAALTPQHRPRGCPGCSRPQALALGVRGADARLRPRLGSWTIRVALELGLQGFVGPSLAAADDDDMRHQGVRDPPVCGFASPALGTSWLTSRPSRRIMRPSVRPYFSSFSETSRTSLPGGRSRSTKGHCLRPARQVGTLGVHATRRMPPRFPPRKSAATAA